MELEFVKSDLVKLFNNLASDEEDTVRLLAVEACSSIASILPDEDKLTLLMPTVRAAVQVHKPHHGKEMKAQCLHVLCAIHALIFSFHQCFAICARNLIK